MDKYIKKAEKVLNQIDKVAPSVISTVEKIIEKVPALNEKVGEKYDEVLSGMGPKLRPYKDTVATYAEFPKEGKSYEEITELMDSLRVQETDKWKNGFVSGTVYHGDDGHIDFLNNVYAMHSQTNPLHSDLWPSLSKYEAEIIGMTANMLGGRKLGSEDVCGTVTSGGTESILLAIKTYRDWAYEKKRIRKPELIVPVTAHAAFDKACQFFKIKMIKVPVDSEYKADVKAVKKAINRNTIAIVGSACSFPHGVIDPIKEMSELAFKHKIGFHTDSCLGGFVLPWAKKLGYDVPDFDFSLRGVTSMSADTHKFGYAPKGTSVVLYRNIELIHYQYFTMTDWPGGIYFSPTLAGSRPGALSAACWASLVSVGEKGYLENTQKILDVGEQIKKGIEKLQDVQLFGDALWVIAFGSDSINIFDVLDQMSERGWSLNGLHKPACVHICVTLRHTEAGVAERFLKDLEESIEFVKANPTNVGDFAPIYGMAANIPAKRTIGNLLKKYLDLYYKC